MPGGTEYLSYLRTALYVSVIAVAACTSVYWRVALYSRRHMFFTERKHMAAAYTYRRQASTCSLAANVSERQHWAAAYIYRRLASICSLAANVSERKHWAAAYFYRRHASICNMAANVPERKRKAAAYFYRRHASIYSPAANVSERNYVTEAHCISQLTRTNKRRPLYHA